jgi:hypothetical protein
MLLCVHFKCVENCFLCSKNITGAAIFMYIIKEGRKLIYKNWC